jgi:hypothetical protein
MTPSEPNWITVVKKERLLLGISRYGHVPNAIPMIGDALSDQISVNTEIST